MKYKSQYEMMTEKPIPGLIVKLGIPTMISMFVTTIYNMADSYFVGQINTSASGATSVVLGLMAILQAVGFMFGHGCGSLISRMMGKKDIDSAKRYSATAFYSALAIGIIALLLGTFMLTPLMYLLGSTPTILPYAKTYAFCILCAAPALVSSCVMNNILRYEGRAVFAMIGLTSGGIVNIFLDALFMVKMDMGILGAGMATAISQYLSWFILLAAFLFKKPQTSLAFKYARFDFKTLSDILTIGLPSLARQGLASISTMLLNNSAGVYGDAAIAAMGIAGRVSMFIFSAVLGIGQGFQPVAGFNFGAKKYKRIGTVMRCCYFVTALVAVACAAILLIFRHPLLALYIQNGNELALEAAYTRFYINIAPYFTLAFMEVGSGVLRGLGKSTLSTVISLLGSCVFRLLWIYFIFPLCPTLWMVYLSYPISWTLTALTHFTVSMVVRRRYMRMYPEPEDVL